MIYDVEVVVSYEATTFILLRYFILYSKIEKVYNY